MTRFLSSRRARVVVGVCLQASALYAVLSLRDLGEEGGVAVLDSPLLRMAPRICGPGWRLVPPGLLRLTVYSEGSTRLSFHYPHSGTPRLSSSEGVSVEVVGEVSYRIPAERVLQVHRRAHGDPVGALLHPFLRTAVFEAVRGASFSRISGAHRFELESMLSTRLGPRLREAGLRFLGVRVEAVRVAAGSLAGVRLRSIPGNRLLVIGLDGADWRVIDPLVAQGKLPHLARLIAGGTRARLRSIEPILSPVVWTTIATGFLPEEHGILDFLVTDTRTGERVPVTSRQRKVRAIWNLLGDAGVAVGIIAWWATWPAEEVDGYLVSDRVAYQLLGQGRLSDRDPKGKAHPPDLFGKIQPLVVLPEAITDRDLAPFVGLEGDAAESWPGRSENRIDEFRTVLAASRTYEGIAQALGSGGFQPFEAIYFEGIDTTSHLFMPFRPPKRPGISAQDYQRFSRAVDAFYVHQDDVIGRLLEKASPGTSVLVISDHGFRSEADRPARESRIGYATAATWHRRYGILIATGGPFRKGATLNEASALDIAPTILAFFGLPIGEDMQGRPIRELFTPEFLKEHPVRYRPSWETGRFAPAADVVDPAGDQALKEKLLSLGYLSQEGSLSHNNLGNSRLSRGDVEGAIREFLKAVEEAPGFALARVNLGRSYLARGDLALARQALEAAMRLSPDSPEAQLLLANLERVEGKREAAELRLRRVLQLDSSLGEAHKSLALLYQESGRVEMAVEAYRRGIAIDPEDPEGYNNLGVLFREQGRPEEAEVQFRKAIEADSDYAGAYNNLALISMDRQEWDKAEQQLRQALERSPDDPTIHNNLGNLHFRRERPEQAEAEYRRALELRPRYAEPHNGLGAIRGMRGDRAGEIEAYRQAVEADPSYADGWFNLGLALEKSGRTSEAEETIRKVLALEPARVDAVAALSRLLIARGRPEEAVGVCRDAIAARDDRADLWNLLGEAAMAAGDGRAAAEAFRSSLTRNPDQPAVRRRLREALGK